MQPAGYMVLPNLGSQKGKFPFLRRALGRISVTKTVTGHVFGTENQMIHFRGEVCAV